MRHSETRGDFPRPRRNNLAPTHLWVDLVVIEADGKTCGDVVQRTGWHVDIHNFHHLPSASCCLVGILRLLDLMLRLSSLIQAAWVPKDFEETNRGGICRIPSSFRHLPDGPSTCEFLQYPRPGRAWQDPMSWAPDVRTSL
jgi:hypothetical protein